mgnify:FL=1
MRKITTGPHGDLPATPRVGDKIRLKEKFRLKHRLEAEQAGWVVDPEAVKLVTREDKNQVFGWRLFFEGVPFCYASSQVELAWNSMEERREGLRKAGHEV